MGCKYCGEEIKEPGHLGICNVYQAQTKEVLLMEAFKEARIVIGLIRNNAKSDFSSEVEYWYQKYMNGPASYLLKTND